MAKLMNIGFGNMVNTDKIVCIVSSDSAPAKRMVQKGIARAVEEAEGIESYDYLVVNDVLEDCVEEVHQIIQNEHYRVNRNESAIQEMWNELKAFSK